MQSRTTHRGGHKTASIHIGVGGWNYAPWRGVFYPRGLAQAAELEFASRKLTSIEINSTFYGSQKPASFARWYSTVPRGFIFAVKAPRFATHRRVLAEARGSIERFLEGGVLLLREKLGPINWQLPPGKPFDAADLERFLSLLPAQHAGLKLRHAMEVRHDSFDCPRFRELAREQGIAIVLAGDSRYPRIEQADGSFVYARIMGTTGDSGQGYPPAALDAWAGRALEWARAGQEVFLYVISGCKTRNPAAAMALIERVGAPPDFTAEAPAATASASRLPRPRSGR